MINPFHLRMLVIRPALAYLDPLIPYSVAAENLLLGTALYESTVGRETCLRQVGGGPALGIFQVEPFTHTDCYVNWLNFPEKRELLNRVRALCSGRSLIGVVPYHQELVTNLAYAAAIARVKYRRSPAMLPGANDAHGLTMMHKTVYNTAGGATDVMKSFKVFEKVVEGGEFGATS